MPVQTTNRLALPYPDGNDDVANGNDVIQALAEKADNLVPYSQGTLASRPVSTNPSPGIVGRRYYATDAQVEFLDLGTSWVIARATTLVAGPSGSRTTTNASDSLPSGPTLIVPVTGTYDLEFDISMTSLSTGANNMSALIYRSSTSGVISQGIAFVSEGGRNGGTFSRKLRQSLVGNESLGFQVGSANAASSQFIFGSIRLTYAGA